MQASNTPQAQSDPAVPPKPELPAGAGASNHANMKGDQSDSKKEDDIPHLGNKGPKEGAIHSDLKDQLDAEIAKKPEKDWGVTQHLNTDGKSDDAASAAAPAGAATGATPAAPSHAGSTSHTDGNTKGAEHKESLVDKAKHILHK